MTDKAPTGSALQTRPATAPAVPAPRRAGPLTRRQKAAVIVRLLMDEGEFAPFSRLEAPLQADLTAAMASMRYVDRDTLRAVVREFLAELEGIGVSFPGGIDRALALLEGHISAQAAETLRQGTGVPPDPWRRIATLPTEEILPLLDGESAAVVAVVLSKLATARAAEILEQLDGTRARDIALAMPATADTAPETVARIGATLVHRLDTRPARAFAADPAARVGAMLNLTPARTRDALLAGIDSADQDFAESVRRAIFTFRDIPARVDPRDVPKALKGLDQDLLVTALAAAGTDAPDAADFLLDNLSKRMAEQLREAVEDRAPVKRREADAAHAAVVEEIRRLAEGGEIDLITSEEEDEI